MYAPHLLQRLTLCAGLSLFAFVLAKGEHANAQQVRQREQVIFDVNEANDRLEMIVNTSRILTLDQKIPQAQVNNPEVLEITPLSPTQIQILAKNPGVTQVNLWDEENQIRTVDVIVYGDAQELEMVLQSQFPKSSLKVIPLANSVIVSGFVDRPDIVNRIVAIAEDYHPKVINNISVGGVQQVLLHVKVMEISRTKSRTLGFDFVQINGDDFVTSGISGLLGDFTSSTGLVEATGGQTASFGIINNQEAFFGLLEALRKNSLMKILAEPDLVAVSGRPSSFNVGGEFPILVPQSLGTVSIEYKKFGTQLDFVPIVLGNGRIRLEVRPRVSEIDNTRSVIINETAIPGLRVREVETGVEMRSGQTLAIAGLIQTRLENEVRAVPYLGDLPWLGAAFRRTNSVMNEIELLILVTPELVDALDPHEVPPGGPGTNSCNPNDCQLFWKGHIEVPCPDCGPCAGQGFPGGGYPQGDGMMYGPGVQVIEGPSEVLPGPTGTPVPVPNPPMSPPMPPEGVQSDSPDTAQIQSSRRHAGGRPVQPPMQQQVTLQTPKITGGEPVHRINAPLPPQPSVTLGSVPPTPSVANLPQAGLSNPYQPSNPYQGPQPSANSAPGLIGPLGYDVDAEN